MEENERQQLEKNKKILKQVEKRQLKDKEQQKKILKIQETILKEQKSVWESTIKLKKIEQ